MLGVGKKRLDELIIVCKPPETSIEGAKIDTKNQNKEFRDRHHHPREEAGQRPEQSLLRTGVWWHRRW